MLFLGKLGYLTKCFRNFEAILNKKKDKVNVIFREIGLSNQMFKEF